MSSQKMYRKLFCVVIVVLSVITGSQASSCASNCLVNLPFGRIQGKCINGYCSYTNVPYALAPTGTRRFEPPVPYNMSWSGVRDGTQEAIGCVQFSETHYEPNTSEDCLFLQIYVPGSANRQTYPVRAYIHGGGYMFGVSGDTDPEYIANKDMIVASIGYRLGPLGFLSTGDNCLPGNNGLKDQREALRWMKKFIKYFKGDQNRVLLSGFSAGGASSHLHTLRTEKLFSAVMANNGVAFNPWVFQTKPYLQYSKFVDLLNCPVACSNVRSCIKNKSLKDVVAAVSGMKVFGDNPFNVFGVVVENPNVRDAFITQSPEKIIRSGKTANVPLLLAYTQKEGSYTAAEWMMLGNDGQPLITQINDTNWYQFAPLMLFYNNTTPAKLLDKRSNDLRQKYMGNKPFTAENYQEFENIFTDLLYLDGYKKAICLHRKYAPGQLYVYEYRYPHNYSVGNLMSDRTDIAFGPDHGADGIFALPLRKLKHDSLTENQQNISDRLIELFKSLVNGKPTYDSVALPLNTPTKSGKLTINEYCHDIEYCNGPACGDCSDFE